MKVGIWKWVFKGGYIKVGIWKWVYKGGYIYTFLHKSPPSTPTKKRYFLSFCYILLYLYHFPYFWSIYEKSVKMIHESERGPVPAQANNHYIRL